MKFYVGLHQPSDAKHFDHVCISINRLRERKQALRCGELLLDSGAFTELALYGRYRHEVSEYVAQVRRLIDEGVARIIAIVAQDYMCEPVMLAKTGLTVEDHQRLTIERYDALLRERLTVPVMPVLQGYAPHDYVRNMRAYGDRLEPGMWVGVGSVCKRQGRPEQIIEVLRAIHAERPDLRLHGFGVKLTALKHPGVRELLYSADSMAWSYAARRKKRNANSWQEAERFVDMIEERNNMSRSSISQLIDQVETEETPAVPAAKPRRSRTKAPPNETPAERFVRVGSIRVSAALQALESVAGLASPSYEYTAEQIDAAFEALSTALGTAEEKLRSALVKDAGTSARFQF